MKKFVKLLFIIFYFFFTSLNSGVQSAELSNADVYLSTAAVPAAEELYIKLQNSGAYIVAPNSLSCEITVLKDKKNIFMSGSLDRACPQNKSLQQIFNTKHNNLSNSNSHNISPYLKNEICARAP